MKTSISISTVFGYFDAAAVHCLGEVTNECLLFLEHAFVSETKQHFLILYQNASIELMEQVLARHHLLE